jgi:transcriptional regulator with XRE-family HTH domain
MTAVFERNVQREASRLKQIVSTGLRGELKRNGTSRAALARAMRTSRSAVDRVLDERNSSITLHTLVRAAATLGYRVELKMETRIDKIEEIEAPAELRPLMDRLGEALDRRRAR